MKVIDLLVKIANGEKVPKRFSINDYKIYDEFTIWTFEKGCYYRNYNDDKQFLFEYITTDMLNDELEIIEDKPKEDKKIDNLKLNDSGLWTGKTDTDLIVDKINEIIDKINGE